MILCWGVNHTVATLAQREQVAVPPALISRWLITCREAGCSEVVVLSTCNRTELYAVCPTIDLDVARQCLTQAIAACSAAAAAVFHEAGYLHYDDAALLHLFRVTSSLDAMVVGEPQILGQVKRAYEAACAVGAVGSQLHQWFQRAFRVAKRVREETGVGERPVSIGSVAVALATQLFGELGNCRALVLGSGALGAELLHYLRSAGVGGLAISGRTSERLTALGVRAEAHVIPWSEWPHHVPTMDIVICCTAAAEPVMTPAIVHAVQPVRGQRPLFLIDLSLPRNIDPACAGAPAVYVYDLDDLKAIAADNLKTRRRAVEIAEALVGTLAQSTWAHWQGSRHAVVSSLHQKCEAIRQQEVARTLQQLRGHDDHVAQALDRCTQAIVAKLLHDPIVYVKQDSVPEGARTHTSIEWLRRLFRLA